MPRQNRVNPYGNIIITRARGTFMGNRGILHNNHQQIVRPYKSKAWLICRLEFKDRKRKIMYPGRYTELFFLDEATALAAGHRPCYECRRKQALAFHDKWVNANPELADGPKTKIGMIDNALHKERLTKAYYIKDRHKQSYAANIDILPDGTFIDIDKTPHLVLETQLFPWTSAGYKEPISRPSNQQVTILTPRSTVGVLALGYLPAIHTTAA